MIGSFGLQKQSYKYYELYSFVPLAPRQCQYFHTPIGRRTTDQAPYCKTPKGLVSSEAEKRILLMLAVTRLSLFAAVLVGVTALAAVVWLEARRAEHRRRLLKRLESVLGDETLRRLGVDHFKRAA